MPNRFLIASLILLLPASALAQGRSGGGRTGSIGSLPTAVPNNFPNGGILMSGKVVIDDGTELTEPASIQSICSGQTRTETFTDKHGSFTFQFGGGSSVGNTAFDDVSSTHANVNGPSGVADDRDWQGCQLRAVLAGFSSQTIELGSRVNALQNTDLGKLSLHRLQDVEGTSISVTSAQAPEEARKALQQGRDRLKKQKWDEAEQSFAKAVSIYPKYAVAWFELGRMQIRRRDVASAKASFQKAIDADPKYVNSYDGLAQIAFQAQQWPEVDAVSTKLIVLNPVNFLDAYFMDGVANLYMQKLDVAEAVCRQGIKVDGEQHQFPKLRYLLANVLMQKRQYPEASEQLQQYMAMTRDPNELAEARKQLDQIAKLTAQATPAPDPAKK